MNYSLKLKTVIMSANVIIVVALAWFWAVLTQESQLLAAVLVSGNIVVSVELYSFLSNETRKPKPGPYFRLRY
jgi:hypothetical protein